MLFDKEKKPLGPWQEFRPRPKKVSLLRMFKRMFWNPNWNESLFLVSCSERLLDYPTKHSEDEILNRIIFALKKENQFEERPEIFSLQFRLKQIQRRNHYLTEKIVYHSRLALLKNETIEKDVDEVIDKNIKKNIEKTTGEDYNVDEF